MSGIYTKTVIRVAGLATFIQAAVPAGKVWIITDASAVIGKQSATGATAVFYANGAGYFLAQVTQTTGPTVGIWSGRNVLVAGQIAQVNTSGAAWDVTVTAYELDA
jgi:hypothetical protein